MSEHYTTGKWHHYTTYRCVYCGYSTMDEEEIEQHFTQRHTSQLSVRPAHGGLVNDKGEHMHVIEEQPAPDPITQRGDEHPGEPEKPPTLSERVKEHEQEQAKEEENDSNQSSGF